MRRELFSDEVQMAMQEETEVRGGGKEEEESNAGGIKEEKEEKMEMRRMRK